MNKRVGLDHLLLQILGKKRKRRCLLTITYDVKELSWLRQVAKKVTAHTQGRTFGRRLLDPPSWRSPVRRWRGCCCACPQFLTLECSATRTARPWFCNCRQWCLICSRPWHVTLGDGASGGEQLLLARPLRLKPLPSRCHAGSPCRERNQTEFSVTVAREEMFHVACEYSAKATRRVHLKLTYRIPYIFINNKYSK